MTEGIVNLHLNSYTVFNRTLVKEIFFSLLRMGRTLFRTVPFGRSIIALLFTCILAGCHSNRDKLVWTSIDVNTPYTQADAHLLTFDITNHVLIDTGSRQSGEKLINYFQGRKCRSIQSVIITHGHRDHYGGMIPLLNSGIAVGCVYFNPPPADLVATERPWGCSDEEISEIRMELQKRNIPLKAIKNDTVWVLGNNAVMRVICAFNGLDTPVGRTDINDTSAVMMLTHKNIKIIFAADLNRAIGDYLATNCPPDLLRADILKFPHHGTESFPNDSLFAAVNAKTVIVPAPKELWLSERSARARRLTKDCTVYVNGIDGNISVLSDGNTFSIRSDK